jgi:cell division protein FtsB
VSLDDAPPGSNQAALAVTRGGTRRFLRQALLALVAALLAWLVFAAYRQPDLILDFAGVRLC